MDAQSEATGGGPLSGNPGPGAGPFDREAEVGAADRLVPIRQPARETKVDAPAPLTHPATARLFTRMPLPR